MKPTEGELNMSTLGSAPAAPATVALSAPADRLAALLAASSPTYQDTQRAYLGICVRRHVRKSGQRRGGRGRAALRQGLRTQTNLDLWRGAMLERGAAPSS